MFQESSYLNFGHQRGTPYNSVYFLNVGNNATPPLPKEGETVANQNVETTVDKPLTASEHQQNIENEATTLDEKESEASSDLCPTQNEAVLIKKSENALQCRHKMVHFDLQDEEVEDSGDYCKHPQVAMQSVYAKANLNNCYNMLENDKPMKNKQDGRLNKTQEQKHGLKNSEVAAQSGVKQEATKRSQPIESYYISLPNMQKFINMEPKKATHTIRPPVVRKYVMEAPKKCSRKSLVDESKQRYVEHDFSPMDSSDTNTARNISFVAVQSQYVFNADKANSENLDNEDEMVMQSEISCSGKKSHNCNDAKGKQKEESEASLASEQSSSTKPCIISCYNDKKMRDWNIY
ncbi:unnamed protein product [Thelazia callipaeda]|uniref:General transcriptional corepressor trfA-like n=1 Tax=Thelazia callipaeda TaxID=103827 RepID=A0A0N5CYL6_THECL|nr:unnamed protein product [Thelazia callipaeda]